MRVGRGRGRIVGIDGLHRVEVLQVPGQVVLGGEGGRSQLVLVMVLCIGRSIVGCSIGDRVLVLVQCQSVGVGVVGTRIRLTPIAVAVSVAVAVSIMVWCRHGVPRAREHSGRACSRTPPGGEWADRGL